MIKRIIIGTFGFIIGIGTGYYSESFFRNIIQDIFKFTTFDKIQFVGKNFYVFSNKTYVFVIGFAIMLFLLANLNFKPNRIFKNLILFLLIFGISIFGISAIDANLKVVQCTACDNGILKIHWNGINYGLIIGISAIFSIIPSVIILITKIKANAHHRV